DLYGGKQALAFDKLLSRAASDCEDRPAVKKSREVTMKVIMAPIIDQDGFCEEIALEIETHASIPKYRGSKVHCRLRKNGVVVFDDLSTENPDQASLPFPAEDNES